MKRFLSFAGNLPQLLAAIAGTINAISDGMQYGWSAPVVPLLQSEDSKIRITEDDETWLETIYLLGSVASLPVTIYLVDRIGRKYTILSATVTSLIAWLLIGVATSREYLYAGRFLAGLAGDVAFVAAPMYVAEIADQRLRGFLSSIIYLMMLLGILLIYAIAPFVPFYAPSIVAASILLMQLISLPFMPESPYYLLKKDRKEAALKSLTWLRPSDNNNEDELQEILTAIKIEEADKGRCLDIVKARNNFKALRIVVILNAAQHFCGITVFMMNVHSILDEAGFNSLNPNVSAIIFSAIMLISATFSSFTVDKYGRKILLIASSVLTGFCLLILAIYFNMKDVGQDVADFSWIPVLCVMLYAAVFKFGLGMVPIVLTAELFSSEVKAMGMTIADAVYVIAGSLSIIIYQQIVYACGMHVAFYIFACLGFLIAGYSMLEVPETKGRSLDDIQWILKGEDPRKELKEKEIGVNNNAV